MTGTELLQRLEEYAKQRRLKLGQGLGAGVHGIVFAAQSQSSVGRVALKAHRNEADYRRERDAYLRLRERQVVAIRGCNVPERLGYDDSLFVIEMTVVVRAFVLDFGGAFLDDAPEFPDEVLADWRSEKMEQFGPRWPEVQSILAGLQSYGIYLLDVNPGNISFAE